MCRRQRRCKTGSITGELVDERASPVIDQMSDDVDTNERTNEISAAAIGPNSTTSFRCGSAGQQVVQQAAHLDMSGC